MLERAEVVERRSGPRGEAHEYVLTEAGEELKPLVAMIGEWGQRWARDIANDDLDPEWLVWNMRRRLDLAAMPAGRTVIEIAFSDAPAKKRRFWLVCGDGKADVCLKPPGFDADVTVSASVRVLAEAWRGLRAIPQEIGAGRIRLEGKSALCRAFPSWLQLSVYAPIKRRR
jgi:hypothetical protein